MFSFLHDLFTATRLKARYRRLISEQLVELTEQAPRPVAEEPGRWTLLGQSRSAWDEPARADLRTRVRQLVVNNPHAHNLLRLLEIYTVGPGLRLTHSLLSNSTASRERSSHTAPSGDGSATARDHDLSRTADHLWSTFLAHNHRHFSFREYARRTWRDGETFLRLFSTGTWPPTIRFLDPETIGATPEHPESQGILTDPYDVESPRSYLYIDPQSRRLLDHIPAEQLIHTRIGADSNQKRGLSLFASLLEPLHCFDKWLDTELIARKLQASIVLWRKVQGSPAQLSAFADAQHLAAPGDPLGAGRRERVAAGTILTTSHGTELEYLQPNTNFGDAVPLGRMLLLSCAAGAGLPEFMLTSDASNANFASTMVAEGPAVKLFQSEQEFFAAEFGQLWRWVMSEAVAAGLLPDDFFDRIHPEWTFPQLVSRDRPRERLADARLVAAQILSRAEVARRDGVDPQTMRTEIRSESASAPVSNSLPIDPSHHA